MNIVMDVTAPPELVRIAESMCGNIESIRTVKFVAHQLPNAEIGEYDPNTDLITVDLGNCIFNRTWMDKGMLLVPNLWFNMLYALFHERAHAGQKLESPELLAAGMDLMDGVLEHAAHKESMGLIDDWVSNGGSIPDLHGLGWAGEQISKMMNALYASRSEEVSEELDAMKMGVVANVEALPPSTFSDYNDATVLKGDSSLNVLRSAIDKGDVGKLIEERRYLTAEEFLSL